MLQMSPIYSLIMMLYFIFMLMISITMIYFFLSNVPSSKSLLMKENNSMDWMW